MLKNMDFHIKNRDFQKSERNSKIFPKNVKFDLQTHFNIEITLNGLDSSFEAYPIGFGIDVIQAHMTPMSYQPDSLSLYIYIYIGKGNGAMDSIEALRATAQISSFCSRNVDLSSSLNCLYIKLVEYQFLLFLNFVNYF